MSVVREGKTVFCEGKESSLDYSLLQKIVIDNTVSIVSAGSKFTFSIFAEGYFYKSNSRKYIVFRDRDFDIRPTETVQLLQLGKMFLTHRACVENYLLDADLIDSYWKEKYREKQENSASRWGHKDSPGIRDISDWIEISAKALKEYQAVRWALGDLSQISGARSQIKTTWTRGSGNLPESLNIQDCKANAINLLEEFRNALETVTKEKFEARLDEYRKQFEDSEFWINKHYLIWFHGKDIQKEMQIQRQSYISLENFFDWAVSHIDIMNYPDLIELQNKIENM